MPVQTPVSIRHVAACTILASMWSSQAFAQSGGQNDSNGIVSRVSGDNGAMMTAADLAAYYQLMAGPQAGIDPAVAQQFLVESVREWMNQQQLTPQQAVQQLQSAFADFGGMPEGLADRLLVQLAILPSDYTEPAYLPVGPLSAPSRPGAISWWPYFDPTFFSGMSRLSDEID